MDLELLFFLALSFVTGVLGGFAGSALARVTRTTIPILPAFIVGHEHEWAIKGKRNGRVRQYCTHPRCTVERYMDEGG